MRGVDHKLVAVVLWLACAAATGCITPAADEPLTTPYSAQAAPQRAPSNRVVQTTTKHPQTPYKYSPTAVDPDLLEGDEVDESFNQKLSHYLSPKNINAAARKAVGLGPNEAIAQKLYAEGDQLFRQAKYMDAAKRFKSAGRRWPDSTLEEDALFMQAEAYFLADRYPKASDIYTNLLKKYENSRHLDMIIKRRFAIGRYWEQLGKDRAALALNATNRTLPFWDLTGNAIAVYESIRMDDPTGPLADDATMATANAHFLRGRYEDAAYHYDLVRTEFPQSEFQPQAHLLGMQAKLLSYQGPHYDAKPLKDADQIAKNLQSQFPGQLQGEQENIQQTQKAIQAQLAERDWATGEYYHKTRHYAAARYYYNEVVKQHPQSRFADLAKARVEEIRDKPPDPANEVEWLASKFNSLRNLGRSPPAEQPPAPTDVPQDQPALARQPQRQP